MKKFRFRFRLWHLLFFVLLAAIGLWGFTQYGTHRCVVLIEKYRVVKSLNGNEASVQIVFRFQEPAQKAGKVFDYGLSRVPVLFLSERIETGREIQFSYREKPLWIGVGNYTFWEAKQEDPVNKFWLKLFRPVQDRPYTKREIEIRDELIDGHRKG